MIRTLRVGSQRLASRLPLVRLVLFGSHASGRATVASDVDVLVVYRGEEHSDAYAVSKLVLAIPRLEPHVYSEREYETISETIERMVRDGVEIYPVE